MKFVTKIINRDGVKAISLIASKPTRESLNINDYHFACDLQSNHMYNSYYSTMRRSIDDEIAEHLIIHINTDYIVTRKHLSECINNIPSSHYKDYGYTKKELFKAFNSLINE